LAGGDTGILGFRRAEYSGLVAVWMLSQEKPIGNDRADKRSYEEEYQVSFKLYGVGELKNGSKSALGLRLPSVISNRRLDFNVS